jgi:DNA-binding transcriptional regulator YhcF (GntR family)
MTATRSHSLIDHLAESLRERLLVKRDGEKLLTVRELMASLGVSQNTVPCALSKLKQRA